MLEIDFTTDHTQIIWRQRQIFFYEKAKIHFTPFKFEVILERSLNFKNLSFTPSTITTLSMCPFCYAPSHFCC